VIALGVLIATWFIFLRRFRTKCVRRADP